ncbi:MAG: aminopeptidase P N-terminal domain-containing protein [gamma proteobacterium symbiont of Bathyaustriella thionipta]|nr:aminopeptidase P N-terminal domain-containing protein [gamma proteobacterium symbiont of Bathyaustriella thionipta]
MNQTEFSRRRKQLMRMMGSGSIAILPTSQTCRRNGDVDHVFHPDSNFYYLSGFPEAHAIAVLIPERKHGEYILFCEEKDEQKELWEGRRAGQQGAIEQYGADDSFPIDDVDDILPRMLEQAERVFYVMGAHPHLDSKLSQWINRIRSQSRNGKQGPLEIIALDHYLHDLRLYKSRSEIKFMRQAARISCAAHVQAMRLCKPGLYEYQLQAAFTHACSMQGARQQAYPTIAGGGENGCILHYTDNNDVLNEGDLVLMDAGCEVDCYASDITRCWPVNGRFSEPQRQLYELVLQAQLAAIEQVKPGNHWNDPHEAAVKVLTRGLIKLGLLKGTPARLIKSEAYKKFYMHRTGHWLGMDVHDVGDYQIDGAWRVLEAGMVLTVEPGLYIPRPCKGVARKWQGIGIRIEDDVLVTKTGHDVLSSAAPKTVDEIEALMAR